MFMFLSTYSYRCFVLLHAWDRDHVLWDSWYTDIDCTAGIIFWKFYNLYHWIIITWPVSWSSVDGSLSDNSDNSEEDSSDKEERANREGHPIGSGLSAATRMRFEKKRAQYVERQSAEQRFPPEEPVEYEVEKPAPRAQFG